MYNKKNITSALINEFITMISGLILPRLIIGTFGSELNGLVSSITQFLSFISLLEGGLGAVVLAELYKPIENHDENKIQEILSECQNFFTKLAAIYIAYTVVLGIVYPIFINASYGFIYTSSLVVILSCTTLVRYLFSITNRLYLQANQKIYIVNIITAVITATNLIIAIIVIKVYPEIHVLKIMSDILFLIQPVAFNRFVDKKFHTKVRISKKNTTVLTNRWSGFSQNLAYFINMNTDVAVITVFLGLKEVSVYNVYMLAVNALRKFMSLLSNSYQSALGKYYVAEDKKLLGSKFNSFDSINTQISLIAFNTCLLLINPFVSIYTMGVEDANYYQPAFALVIVLANLIYCIREPYRYVVLVAGKFKETNFGSMMEAILNIGISLILVRWLGLLGVAIGTFIAIGYRYIYFIIYLKKDVIYLDLKRFVLRFIVILIVCIVNVVAYFVLDLSIANAISFILYGFGTVLLEAVVTFSLFWIEGKIESRFF